MLFNEPKLLKSEGIDGWSAEPTCFSALQRAEIAEIGYRGYFRLNLNLGFQCSSASRKFLNYTRVRIGVRSKRGFSALQRAENSSIVLRYARRIRQVICVSVLFSEPKIPQ